MTLTEQAMREAARFLAAINEYRRAVKGQEAARKKAEQSGQQFYSSNTGPEHAAAKRASMDLTRALAAWRQSPTGWREEK